MGQTWDDAKDLLARALELPVHARDAFVREHCRDPKVLEEVLALLHQPDSSLESEQLPSLPSIEEEAELPPGTRIGAYTIADTIATGGMGRVYLAKDPTLKRRVAIKSLRGPEPQGDVARSVIRREAQNAAQITSPHVATIHGFFEDGGRSYIVMEYVDGESLSQVLQRGRLPSDRVLQIGRQLTTGLAAAHAKGVVHRDLKPANIQLTADGSVKILDFGIASVKDAFTTRNAPTRSSDTIAQVAGTPGYMSPEQWRGRAVDERSDIFSLGLVLFEMATGRRACASDEPIEASAPPLPRADALNREVPRSLADVIGRAVAINPAERFGSAIELREALEGVQSKVTGRGTGAQALRWLTVALALSCLAIALGYVNTTTYDVALERQDYMNENVWSWLTWGLRSLIAVGIVALGIAALIGLVVVGRNVVLPMSARLRAWDAAARARLRSPLLASWVVLGLGALLAFAWWSYAPYFGALLTPISGLTPAEAAIMGPAGEAYRYVGEIAFTLLTIAAAATAFWIGHTAGPAASPASRALIAVTWAIALLALVSFELPYRFFRPSSVVERADWNNQPCYILARREADRLLYCPTVKPAVQSRPVSDPAVVPKGVFGNAYDR